MNPCECGCGEMTPRRFRPGHNRKVDADERFWNFVDKRGPDDCWNWTGYIDPEGYGRFSVGYKNMGAHRFSYERANGRPIPDGWHTDHLCRNRACVNPVHLEAVTNRENALRGIGPSAVNAKRTHCKSGHEFTTENTYIKSNGNRMCKACARIRHIKRRDQRRSQSLVRALGGSDE